MPDVTDPDHEEFHRENGTIIEVIKDAAGETPATTATTLYRIELNCGEVADI